jgi:hypothetical protein
VAWQALAKQSIGTFGCSNAIVATLCFFIMDRRICAGSRHLPALFFCPRKSNNCCFPLRGIRVLNTLSSQVHNYTRLDDQPTPTHHANVMT